MLKNWKPYLATLAAGIVIGYLLHQPSVPIADQTSTATSHFDSSKASHESKTKDTDSVRVVVRYVNITPPPAKTDKVFGKLDLAKKCDMYFVAKDTAGGTYEGFIYGIQGCQGDSALIVASKRNLAVTDTFSKSTHTETTRDSASHVSSDSSSSKETLTVASHSLYDLSVELSTPVFHNGTFGYQPFGTLVSIPVRLHITQVLTSGLRPEILLLTPSIGSARIYLDFEFKIAGH